PRRRRALRRDRLGEARLLGRPRPTSATEGRGQAGAARRSVRRAAEREARLVPAAGAARVVSPDAEQPPPEERSPLPRAVGRGVKWGTASAGAIFVLGLVQTAALAHLLTPEDFGLMAAALVVIGLARAFADLGLSSAIVARQVRDQETLSSLYWASLIAG